MTTTTVTTTFGDVTITDGVLDDAATRVLMTGWCVALAVAINQRTGWPVVIDTGGQYAGGDDDLIAATVYVRGELQINHAFVRLPDGRLLDAMGIKDADTYVHNIETEFDEDVTFFTLDHDTAVIVAEHYCPAPRWDLIDNLAQLVLRHHGQEA